MKFFFKQSVALFLLFFLMLGGSPFSLLAQQNLADNAAAADMKAEIVDERLYLEFKSASLINVLGILSELTKINFVAGSEVANRPVNMSLDGVTLDQALLAISNGSNVTYANIPESNIIMFRASSDAVQLAPLFTRVFKLYFLRASKIQEIDAGESSSGGSGGSSSSLQSLTSSDNQNSQTVSSSESIPVIKIVEKMLSERGAVAVDDRSNSIVVTDTEDRLARVAAVIAELDRPLNQVLINVLLIETFEDLDREFGIEWSGDFGTLEGGSRTSKFPFNMSDNFFGLGGGGGSILSSDNTTNVLDSNLSPGSKDFTDLTVNAKALQTASKLRILAKPNILVMDNHPAIIKIATNAAIGEEETVTGGADAISSTTSGTERAEVGTILRVTPQINSQDQITMTIEPIFATVDTSTIIGAGTGDTTVRAARTTLMVNSGKTLVMGGLLFSEQTDGSSKVPFLSDIPGIGRLFTKEDKTIEDRELVLFLTPQIIKNPAAMNPSYVPDRQDRFENESAEFWKYKQKNWYKKMNGQVRPPVEFDDYFKVREKSMDEMAFALQDQKESAMKSEVQTVGKTQSVSDGVSWEVR